MLFQDIHSSVAQLVEQLTVNQLVAGSSPARGATATNYPVLVALKSAVCKFLLNLIFCSLFNSEYILNKKL